MTSYARLDQITARLLGANPSTVIDDDLLQQALDFATEFINSYCHRSFGDPVGSQYFTRDNIDPRDPKVLYLDDDITSVSALTNGDGSTIASSEYWLEPRNAPMESPPEPYYAIRLKSTTAWVFPTDGYVQVSGSWGYSAQANGLIVGSCLRLAEYFYRSKSPLTSTTLFDGSVQRELPEGFPTEILTALDLIRKLAP